MSEPVAQPQPDMAQQLNEIMNLEKAPVQLKYQGIQGFSTAVFGQTWMKLQAPGSEQKVSIPTPMTISSQPLGQQPAAYSERLLSSTGIEKVEIINNEVIAAGQELNNPSVSMLVHCRVSPGLLEFTIRSTSQETSAQVISAVKAGF